MTTAELGLVTTAIVGVAAAASPALVSWANRRHEQAMARSTRLYEQRRNAYHALAVFLERVRLALSRSGRNWPEPPTRETADEWTDLMALAAVAGSAEVQTKLAAFHEEEENYHIFSGGASTADDLEQSKELREEAEEFRSGSLKLIDEIEQAMRDELATL
jgi:hypothetical protein